MNDRRTPPPRRQHGRTLSRAVEDAWPQAVDLVLLTIAAGFLPREALHTVAPSVDPLIGDCLQRVEQRCRAGERFGDALVELRVLGPPAVAFADGLAAADRYGMPLAPVLERLAADARDQRRRAGEARARQLPVRMALPMVLCTLPAFVLLAIVPMLIGAITHLRR